MLYVPMSLIFADYITAFGDNSPRIGFILAKLRLRSLQLCSSSVFSRLLSTAWPILLNHFLYGRWLTMVAIVREKKFLCRYRAKCEQICLNVYSCASLPTARWIRWLLFWFLRELVLLAGLSTTAWARSSMTLQK